MFYINNMEYSSLLIFSIIINAVMYVYLYKKQPRPSHSTKLLCRLILATIFVGLCETSAWLFAVPDNQFLRPVHYLCNALFLSFNALPAAFGLCYLDYRIFVSKTKNKKNFIFYLTPVYLNIVFMICNIFFNGFLFSVDTANQYHRGVATYIGIAFTYLIAAIAVVYFSRNKKMIIGRITQAIITITLLPAIGALLQLLIYGLSLGMPAYTLAIFISFLLLEKDELLKDPLTLLNSRIQMEDRLQFKIKSQEPFTVIMMDVNNFKKINDNHGHTTGDLVLKDVSRILLSSANFEDFVCRYGGDEFFIILESTNDIGQSYIKRIDQVLLEYSSHKLFSTTLSYGFLYVDHSKKYTAEELIQITDQRMYDDKMSRKHSRKQPTKLASPKPC